LNNLEGTRSVALPAPVQFLDEDGELVGGEPPMNDQLALDGFRVMLRGRRFDERCVSLQR